MVFAGIVTVTGALPEPLTGATPKPLAVQAESGLLAGQDETTFTVARPPAEDALMVDGLIANEQFGPNCVMVYCCPLTVIVPVR